MRRLMTLGVLAAAACGVALVAALAPSGRAAAQPQPTLVLSPSSGPCDAAVEVAGSGFPPPLASPLGPTRNTLGLYLVRPGTADISMDILNAASNQPDGTFAQWVPLHSRGCEAATLDSQAPEPTGQLLIAVTFSNPPVQPGERIPNIIAEAHYRYTTTALHVPTEALSISPASGPCNGTVDITGSGFEPGMEVQLKLARPGSDGTLGTLASAVAGADGEFVVGFALGELGCRAAQMDMVTGDRARPSLAVWAYRASSPSTPVPLAGYPTPMPVRIDTFLAGVTYAYTTTEVGGGTPPQALPATGSGSGQPSAPAPWVPLIGGVAALGLILVAASLYARRVRS
jgi:hypothetical protein